MEFDRTPSDAKALQSLASKVRVRTDTRLEAFYPETWPARVVVKGWGKRKSLLIRFPIGDSRNPMQWDDVLAKSPSEGTVISCIRATKSIEPIPSLVMRYDARC